MLESAWFRCKYSSRATRRRDAGGSHSPWIFLCIRRMTQTRRVAKLAPEDFADGLLDTPQTSRQPPLKAAPRCLRGPGDSACAGNWVALNQAAENWHARRFRMPIPAGSAWPNPRATGSSRWTRTLAFSGWTGAQSYEPVPMRSRWRISRAASRLGIRHRRMLSHRAGIMPGNHRACIITSTPTSSASARLCQKTARRIAPALGLSA